MSIFKNATEVFIPESVLNTEAWISDSELLNAFYDIDVADLLIIEISKFENENHVIAGGSKPLDYEPQTDAAHVVWSGISGLLGDAA